MYSDVAFGCPFTIINPSLPMSTPAAIMFVHATASITAGFGHSTCNRSMASLICGPLQVCRQFLHRVELASPLLVRLEHCQVRADGRLGASWSSSPTPGGCCDR